MYFVQKINEIQLNIEISQSINRRIRLDATKQGGEPKDVCYTSSYCLPNYVAPHIQYQEHNFHSSASRSFVYQQQIMGRFLGPPQYDPLLHNQSQQYLS